MNFDDFCKFQDKLFRDNRFPTFTIPDHINKNADNLKIKNDDKFLNKGSQNDIKIINIFSKKEKFEENNNSCTDDNEESINSTEQCANIINFSCNFENCNKAFTSFYGLKYHIKNMHLKKKGNNNNKPFVCNIKNCKKSYKNSNGLKYHFKTVHRNEMFHHFFNNNKI